MRTILFITALFMSTLLSAQKPVEIPLWPNGAPNTNGLTGDQEDLNGGRVANVVNPTITVYRPAKPKKAEKEYLLVDGYNIIFAWDELKALSKINIDSARDRLKDILCNYQGYRKCTLILVFDAYRVKGHREEITKYHNIHVVYTKEAETADMFIEKTVHAIGRKYQVTVATSDGLEQVIIMGQGGKRLSAAGLKEEVDMAAAQMKEHLEAAKPKTKTYLGEYFPEDSGKAE